MISDRKSLSDPDGKMMMDLVERLWPLHRTLVSDDMETTLDIIGEYLPAEGEYHKNHYPSGEKAWTWVIPEKFVVNEAYMEAKIEGEYQRIVDFADNPLHVVSYSPPFSGNLSFKDLDKHLYSNPKRPDAIPWVFKYYERDWGFCMPHSTYEKLPRGCDYRVVMDTEFVAGNLGVGEFTLEGQTGDYLLIVCATCHPMQVNDSISGVAVAVDFAQRLAAETTRDLGLKILFLPEVIGSVAYLAANEDLIPRFRCGIFTEFVGHDSPIRLQRSREDNHEWDRIARYVLNRSQKGKFLEGAYCSTVITNDEKVTNAPGVDIPTIAINRWPDGGWDRYHTSDDNPSVMIPEKLAEVSRLYDDFFRIADTNFYPRSTFRGPLFLSGLGLSFDWQSDPQIKRGIRELTYHLEGDRSAFDLAEICGLEYEMVLLVLGSMMEKGLVEGRPDLSETECG